MFPFYALHACLCVPAIWFPVCSRGPVNRRLNSSLTHWTPKGILFPVWMILGCLCTKPCKARSISELPIFTNEPIRLRSTPHLLWWVVPMFTICTRQFLLPSLCSCSRRSVHVFAIGEACASQARALVSTFLRVLVVCSFCQPGLPSSLCLCSFCGLVAPPCQSPLTWCSSGLGNVAL